MIGELEDAVIARIQSAQEQKLWPYKLLTIETYGGQIAEDRQSTFRFPAVFVSYTGHKTVTTLGERSRIIEVGLVIYIAARNPRNERATRHGDQHEPGSYQIAEDLIALLENQRLGMPMVLPLQHTKLETLFVASKSDGAKAESILAVTFNCQFGWQAAMPECANVTADDWLATGQGFYIKPGDDNPDLVVQTVHLVPDDQT
jgi:phage gp37-like protein